ncbi:PRC-barrel domain-containing protein [Salipaludibacillus aurantiacus]|uniref:PRC-barrel domain-containing protein n=1 Tax=Salipaludibacillus aurantiacus TaxID=1601833 RepID=A0A1H9RHP2_9BACI|nr:PRC-barrel domain-containing protein [Salipaludibacillus aurantiacus]SER72148.1 PRC-barrel domain-containing protein [Salipaludibacillus aurantiacus]
METELYFSERLVDMLLHYSWLTSYTVYGNDGEIGKVKDVYFDEIKWTIRYLVVNTGKTFLSDQAFISPASVEKIDHQNEVIRAGISNDEVQKSPDPGEEPVTRKFEKDFTLHYRLNPYWVGNGVWGTTAAPHDMMNEEAQLLQPEQGDDRTYVHQAKNVTGYTLSVKDETFGKIDDLLIDGSTFQIKYFIVDSRKWFPGGKKVIISPQWIDEIFWDTAQIRIDVTRQQIEDAPEYRPEMDLSDRREADLWLHYKK